MNNPLLDLDFLKQLDLYNHRETYAKITLLTFDEEPIEEIQGVITQGSVSVDGAAAIRRSCSLTMVTQNIDINDYYWTLKNKFKLEVGVKNYINPNYPDIIWFKQGIFLFTSINMNTQAQNYTISLSGKDKMCLLNGEISGTLNSTVDFGQIEEILYDEKELNTITKIETKSIPIIDIIRNAVHTYGKEKLENILINDVDEYGLEMLEWRADKPFYFFRETSSDLITQGTFNFDKEVYYSALEPSIKLSELFKENSDFYSLSPEVDNTKAKEFKLADNSTKTYNLIKIEFGDEVGYRLTDLTYPGELVANVGESLTSVLDKIKNTFSDFEYFYDVDGRFVFQKKQTYMNQSFNNLIENEGELFAAAGMYTSSYVYSFEKGNLLTAFTNTPAINNIKNDFSIWGQRKTATGAEIPIHYRYAIDNKPMYYHSVREKGELYPNLDDNAWIGGMDDIPIYYTQEFADVYISYWNKLEDQAKEYLKTLGEWNENQSNIDKIKKYIALKLSSEIYQLYEEFKQCTIKIEVEWQELIYQMSKDYYALEHKYEDFSQKVAEFNSYFYPTGITGYENYYIDVNGFWRGIYIPKLQAKYDFYKELYDENKYIVIGETNYIKSFVEDTELYKIENGVYSITKEYKTQLYTDKDTENKKEMKNLLLGLQTQIKENQALECQKIDLSEPENLHFWIEFLDVDNAVLADYSIARIGNRPKAINDTNIKALYYKEVPEVLFITQDQYNIAKDQQYKGYTFFNLSKLYENYFSISARGKTANDELYSLLNQHIVATESVTLTTIPIYHLQPNNRVLVKDDDSKINGEYIITKITVPLTYNGTSSITATKVVDRIY